MEKERPKIDIDRLREIGWFAWDPLGLDGGTGIWKKESFADEYDSYLVVVAGMLRNGEARDAIVGYLHHVESDWMGLGPKEIDAEITRRLSRVVQAIAEDPHIWIDAQG
ncbi:MAG: hypothetical protein AAGM21_15320 [Pseudomonadota bacterium]